MAKSTKTVAANNTANWLTLLKVGIYFQLILFLADLLCGVVQYPGCQELHFNLHPRILVDTSLSNTAKKKKKKPQ
jgi:hypothetical protein